MGNEKATNRKLQKNVRQSLSVWAGRKWEALIPCHEFQLQGRGSLFSLINSLINNVQSELRNSPQFSFCHILLQMGT